MRLIVFALANDGGANQRHRRVAVRIRVGRVRRRVHFRDRAGHDEGFCSQGEFITQEEPTGLHRATVHEGDIAATEVAEKDPITLKLDLAVTARDGGIANGDITTQAAAQHHGPGAYQPTLTPAGAGLGGECPSHWQNLSTPPASISLVSGEQPRHEPKARCPACTSI